MGTSPVEIVVGLLLLFVLPGYGITRALFPEWRLRGAEALERLVETAALSLVISVALTVLVGFALLQNPSVGFQASWSDPVLESILGGIAVLSFVVAAFRGAFAREPPPAVELEPAPGSEGAWELLRALEKLYREERRLARSLRTMSPGSDDAQRLSMELESVRAESARLKKAREVEFGG